jgi:diguanylate cyclase (GGDEF)-like protein
MSLSLYGKLSEMQIMEIVDLLETADQNHRDWLRRMHVSLVCDQTFEKDVFADDAHRCCMFGRWYYNDVPEMLLAQHEFVALEPLHKSMHDAARLLANIRSRQQQVPVAQYEDFVDRQQAFSRALLSLRDQLCEHLYSFDSLTGLMTRQPFAVILESEYARIERSGGNSCIVLIDIDNFKSINDNYGHLAGDHVLRDIAQYMRSHIRPYDSVCRFGGEEFLMILPNTSLQEGFEIIDRLRQNIAEQGMQLDEGGDPAIVTVSAGIARLSDSGSRTSVGEADRALYKAKNSGRNRVCIAYEDCTPCSQNSR